MSFDALAQTGGPIFEQDCLRVALNAANSLSAYMGDDGALAGPAIDIAHALGRHLNMDVAFRQYAGPAQIIGALNEDIWDIAFLASDPSRGDQLHFTRPYMEIEATCIVRASSGIACLADLDQPGRQIASASGAAYDVRLRKTATQAEIVASDGGDAATSAFLEGRADAASGIRTLLQSTVDAHPGLRLLDDNFAIMAQAIAIRKDQLAACAAVDAFMDSRT